MSLSAAELTLDQSSQCLLILADDWSSTSGDLRLLERAASSQPWKLVHGPWPVLLGRHGLAPGVGQHDLGAPSDRRKHEGDGRSPAGVFALGTAFGFAPHLTRLPFRLVAPDTVAVDDPRSRFYTQIVDRDSISQPDWRSAEKMRGIPHYRLGLAVEYNTAHPVAGAGSCIFLHCFAEPRKTTSGCTAMAEADLASLLRRLDPAARPRLVLLPRAAFAKARVPWGLTGFTLEP